MAERGGAPGRVQGVAGTWPPHGGIHTGGFSAGFGVWSGALEKLREWVRAEAGAGRLLSWVPIAKVALWGGRELMTLALASLVAGFATTPYAAFHFHRVTPYGLLANLAAMPVVSAVVMPAGMLGLVAMPFGFDGFFWWLMGVGIDWMIVVTEWVAALPGAIGRITAFGTGPLIVSSLGIVLLGLLRTPLRWTGAALLLISVVWLFATPQPDVLISGDGHNVAVRGRDGRLHLMKTAKDAFLLKEWLAADADDRDATDASLGEGVSCDDEGCVAPMASGRLVALSLKPDGLADDCGRAALIVTANLAPAACGATAIELKRLRAQGAMALRWTRRGLVIDAVKPRGTNRPWSPSAGDFETEAEAGAGGTLARPADATPAEPELHSGRGLRPLLRRPRVVRGRRRWRVVRTRQGETRPFQRLVFRRRLPEAVPTTARG